MRYEVVVAGGQLVTGQGVVEGHLGIAGGRIVAIAQEPLSGEEMIDARHRIILPGAVDLHVHFNDPGRVHWEGWGPGSRAAASGGVTSVVEMPLNCLPPTTSMDALRRKRAAARGGWVDVGFWGGAVPGNLGELAGLHHGGVFGFKAFLVDSGVPEFGFLDLPTRILAPIRFCRPLPPQLRWRESRFLPACAELAAELARNRSIARPCPALRRQSAFCNRSGWLGRMVAELVPKSLPGTRAAQCKQHTKHLVV